MISATPIFFYHFYIFLRKYIIVYNIEVSYLLLFSQKYSNKQAIQFP